MDSFATCLVEACCGGDLDKLKRFVKRFKVTSEDVLDTGALREVCAVGLLEIAEWLTNRFNLTAIARDGDYLYDNVLEGLQEACENGHLDVAKWLVTTFRITVNDLSEFGVDNEIFIGACRLGNLGTAQWFASRFHLGVDCVSFAAYEARAGGHSAVVEWLTTGLTAAK
jgi:hypothetical protein